MAFSATTLCTYTEGEIFKQARMLFEFLAQVVHCDAMVAFLHLEIRVMVTDDDDADHVDDGDNDDDKIASTKMAMMMMSIVIMVTNKDDHDLLLLPHFERVPLPAHTPVHCQDGDFRQ